MESDYVDLNGLPKLDRSSNDAIFYVVQGGVSYRISKSDLFYGFGKDTVFRGSIDLSSSAPVLPGLYFPTVNGTYTAFGSIVVNLSSGLNVILFDGSEFEALVVPVELTAPGTVAHGNTLAVSGGAVFDALPVVEYETSVTQIFDKADYIADKSFSTTNVESVSVGSAITKYYTIPAGVKFISWSGLAANVGKRIAWVDNSNVLVTVNTVSGSSGTSAVPLGATKVRMRFRVAGDGATQETFMLNWGPITLPYEPYTSIAKINNTKFLKKIPTRKVNSIYATLSGTSPTVNASGWYKACPVTADGTLFGCTGYGFDNKRKLHVVAEYNSTISARVLLFRPQDLVERNLVTPVISTPYKIFDVSVYIDHIQGVTYDWLKDEYLAMGTKKGMSTGSTFTIVIRLSVVGTVLEIIDLPDIIVQIGMIDLDFSGNILIKPNVGSTVYILNRNFRLIDRKTTISQEGLGVNKFTGEIWCASDSHVISKFDKNYNLISTYAYNTFTDEGTGSNVEGIAVMDDGSVVICADANLHGGTVLGNCLFFFDFEHTVNKRKYFDLKAGNSNYKEVDLYDGYLSEIIQVDSLVTDVIVDTDFDTKKRYRGSTTTVAVSTAAFSDSVVNANFIQVHLR